MNETPAPSITLQRSTLFWAYWSILAAFFAGYLWVVRPVMSPNDGSRWDTVWSLVEHGTYQIFDTPEEAEKYGVPQQMLTIDKVYKVGPDEVGRYYSSKPPLMPTVIAGYVHFLKLFVGEPFSKDDKGERGSIHIYGNATLLLFNLVPFLVFLWLFCKWLDRLGLDDFAWCFALLAAGLGTFVTGYLVTLNNHTQAACFAFITAYHLMRIWYDGERQWWRFALAGFCAGWTAINELPAGMLVLVAIAVVLLADLRRALVAFFPSLGAVTIAFFLTNYLAIGTLMPAYLQKDLYDYPGSYWQQIKTEEKGEAATKPVEVAEAKPKEVADPPKKSGIDALNENPESLLVYLLHMTIGHHGLFSLTPIWLLALYGAYRYVIGQETRYPGVHWPILLVTVIVFGFYWIVNDQRNYGGFCHGLRWLIWLSPFWLVFLPAATDGNLLDRRGRKFAWLLLLISIFSTAGVVFLPWYRSWLHMVMLWFGVVDY